MENDIMVTPSNEPVNRIAIQGPLLEHAILSNPEALKVMFYQFLPLDEKIIFADYYGYFGFWFVGTHSFACLSEKRLAVLQVGPFKRVIYRDGFYENMTSGAVMQPSKFWLYIILILGGLFSLALATGALTFVFNFILLEIFGLFDVDTLTTGIPAFLLSFLFMPFVLNALTMAFYRLNPCGFICMIRERIGIYILVNRDKMTKANYFYRLWSQQREYRVRYTKNKMKDTK